VESLQKWQESEITAEISVIGTRASAPLQRHGANIVARTSTLTSNFESFFGTITVSLSSFLSGKLDEVYVAYNHLSGALSYEPRVEKVLPLGDLLSDNLEAPLPEYLYEPDPKSVVDTLALRYVEAFIYQAVAENNACEQCARMFAMHAATENADRMLRDLKHLYQKTRQAQITTELCEIVAGAAAV
jgi:F-type H+-transporting ATPase subunit gamma